MSKALHLNLLNPTERKSTSPVRGKLMLAFAAGLVFSLVLAWAVILAVSLAISSGQVTSLETELASRKPQQVLNNALKAKFLNAQSETDQFSFYAHGRCKRGNLLRLIALAVPEGITLATLEIPEPDAQNLRPKPGSKDPPLQGPLENTERVELRLAGRAKSEEDVFRFMDTLKGPAFTNDLIIAESPSNVADKSPRVLAFRQESSVSDSVRGVYFDVVYRITPREFTK